MIDPEVDEFLRATSKTRAAFRSVLLIARQLLWREVTSAAPGAIHVARVWPPRKARYARPAGLSCVRRNGRGAHGIRILGVSEPGIRRLPSKAMTDEAILADPAGSRFGHPG